MKYQTLLVIQARFNSSRLHGKALFSLGGVPMLVYLIRRLKEVSSLGKLIVATTQNREDELIASLANQEAIEVVRGEDEDVLARYIRCLDVFPSKTIVRITADNPLTDPGIISQVIQFMNDREYDYVRAIDGYPVGVGVDAFSENLLRISYKNSTSGYEREHIDAYVMSKRDKFKIYDLPALPGLKHPNLRLTVDTIEDYNKVKELIESYPPDYFIKLEDAIK